MRASQLKKVAPMKLISKEKAQNGKKMVAKKTTVTKRTTGPKGEALGGEIGRPIFTTREKASNDSILSGKKKLKGGGKMGKCKGGC